MDLRAHIKVNPRIVDLEKLAELTQREVADIAKDVDHVFVKQERGLFASQGASGGERWEALSPAYKKYKDKVKPRRKIMQFTGKLRKSLVNKRDPGHVAFGLVNSKTRGSIWVGTKDVKAAWHADIPGNTLRNRNLPNRDTLQKTEAQERELKKAASDWMVSKLRRVHRAMRAGWSGRAGRAT